MTEQLFPQVFISYSRKDKDYVKSLVAALEKTKLKAWVDWHDIPPGQDFKAEIRQGIENSDAFVFIISPDSVASKYCSLEIAHALEHGVRMLPINYRQVDETQLTKTLQEYEWSQQALQHWKTLAALNWIVAEPLAMASNCVREAVRTDYGYLKEHTRLRSRAIRWEQHHKRGSYTLTRGEIPAALEFLQLGETQAEKPTSLQKEYIKASVRFRAVQRRLLSAGAVALMIMLILAGISYVGSQRADFDLRLGNASEHLNGPTAGDWILAARELCYALSLDSNAQLLDPTSVSFSLGACPQNSRLFVGDTQTNDALFILGRACMALNNLSCAETTFRQILVNPVISTPNTSDTVRNNLALTLIEAQQYGEAQSIIDEMSRESETDNRNVMRLEAKLAYETHDFESAQLLLEDLWEQLNATTSLIRYREEIAFELAMIYQSSGECGLAREFWDAFNNSLSNELIRPNFGEMERREIAAQIENQSSSCS